MDSIEGQDEILEKVDEYISTNNVVIFSKTTCPFCKKVKELLDSLGATSYSVELDKLENGSQIRRAMATRCLHSSVPQVFIGGQHIGGCDDTIAAHESGKLQELLNHSDEKYDYDLIVIGGGSGGLAAAKEAARLHKKVAVFDFVTPTPSGTKWGAGGTRINVGCIPKKLMHQASLLGQGLKDAKKFGWNVGEKVEHNWEDMRENIQNHIKSLNLSYKVELLNETGVEYFKSCAQFIEDHKIKAVNKKGAETIVSANHFIIATGSRPIYPDIEGAKEYGITSDDLFSLKNSPGKTLVVGASYVALECAGFLNGLGLEVEVLVRFKILSEFDFYMGEEVRRCMYFNGIEFQRDCVPTKIEKIESADHKLKVSIHCKYDEVEDFTGEYDTVLFAIGRKPCTDNLGLEIVGVNVNPNGKIPVENEQTNIPYIYAIGDVLERKPQLTPVAMKAGELLARRLYGGSNVQMDYNFVPTTVFAPVEYGSIGFSQEAAKETYGEENIETFRTEFQPLEWALSDREITGFAKIVVLTSEKNRVIGFHYLGPNAGEVTQGFALAMRKGATKEDFDATIGIHPTCAEVFTNLRITNRSKADGC